MANTTQDDFDGDATGDLCDSDIDGDSVSNADDTCAWTDLADPVDPSSGCSLVQLCPCDAPLGSSAAWRNHGQYVSCWARSSESFVDLGLITEAEKDALVSTAAGTSCGQRSR